MESKYLDWSLDRIEKEIKVYKAAIKDYKPFLSSHEPSLKSYATNHVKKWEKVLSELEGLLKSKQIDYEDGSWV